MSNPPLLRWHARALPLLSALLALLSLLAVGAGRAAAADGGGGEPDPTTGATSESLRFGLGPARAVPKEQSVDGRAYLRYAATPGATFTDEIALLNYGTEPLQLQLYATDALQAEDGGFGLLPGGAKPSGAGAWIKLDVPGDGKVTIPPRRGDDYGRLSVPLAVKVPADATPGDHVAGVVASLKVTSTNSQGAQVTLDQRIGLRTYFQVSGDLKPELRIEDLQASYDDQSNLRGGGEVTVSYTVHNTGNIRLDATQDVAVSGLLVGGVTGHPASIKDILPGSRIKVTQTFDKRFGLGPLKAGVSLHPTAVEPTYAQTIPVVTAQKRFWAWPWVLMAIASGALLLLGLSVWRRHRKGRHQRLAASVGPSSAGRRRLVDATARRGRLQPVRGRRRAASSARFLAAAVLGLGVLAAAVPDAQAEPPQGSLGQVMLETNDATGVPANAILKGWWGHEGAKNDEGTGPTFISINAGDETGAVTDAAVAKLHEAYGDDGTFDSLRVAFVPYSADGSNERPQVHQGETVADAFDWFADLGLGAGLDGTAKPNDSVTTVSNGAEYIKWWDAGRPLQGYTADLKVVDIADDSSTSPAASPQGRSILNRWPAGQKISMVLFLSDGTDKTRPGLPTVAVGKDGRALTSWVTFETVAAPDDPSRSSAGYKVLTGSGTGHDAPVPAGDPVQTGDADPSGAAGAGASEGASASPGSSGGPAAGDGATDGASPGATDGASPGTDTVAGDRGSDNHVISSLPGGTPTFVILLVLLLLGAGAWATWWLRSSRSGGTQERSRTS